MAVSDTAHSASPFAYSREERKRILEALPGVEPGQEDSWIEWLEKSASKALVIKTHMKRSGTKKQTEEIGRAHV